MKKTINVRRHFPFLSWFISQIAGIILVLFFLVDTSIVLKELIVTSVLASILFIQLTMLFLTSFLFWNVPIVINDYGIVKKIKRKNKTHLWENMQSIRISKSIPLGKYKTIYYIKICNLDGSTLFFECSEFIKKDFLRYCCNKEFAEKVKKTFEECDYD